MSKPPLHTLLLPGLLRFQFILCAAIFLNDHVLEITDIRGPSMSPTLSPNYSATGARDRVAWLKYSNLLPSLTSGRKTAAVERGDVVLFATPHNPDGIAVKRVVGLPGDTVLLDKRRRPRGVMDGRVNGEARRWDLWEGRVVVPPGHVWVEGDNWRDTYDSNSYGPISKALVRGRAWGLVWPWREFGKRPWEGWRGGTRVLKGDEGGRGAWRDRNEVRTYWEASEGGDGT